MIADLKARNRILISEYMDFAPFLTFPTTILILMLEKTDLKGG